MKSGSGDSLIEFYPSGALSFNWSQEITPNPQYFYKGVGITQSFAGTDTYIFGYSSSQYESGWMAFLTADPAGIGAANYPDTVQALGDIYIYNKGTGEYSQEPLSTAKDTYFPIKSTDFIRVGTTASIDVPQQGGTTTLSSLEALRQVKTIKWDGFSSYAGAASASIVTPFENIEGFTDVDNQSFRVIRRVPTEFYVLVKTKPNAFTGEGLLLPHNFDNKYNARQVATTLGFIKRNQL